MQRRAQTQHVPGAVPHQTLMGPCGQLDRLTLRSVAGQRPMMGQVRTADLGQQVRVTASDFAPEVEWLVDILPAMNDQDSNRSPGGNMLRFALHRQGQNSQVSTRCHGIACRGSRNYWSNNRARTTGLGYHPTGSNVALQT
jgi:hypothetical protein